MVRPRDHGRDAGAKASDPARRCIQSDDTGIAGLTQAPARRAVLLMTPAAPARTAGRRVRFADRYHDDTWRDDDRGIATATRWVADDDTTGCDDEQQRSDEK